jgi:hypothetical protein
MVTGAAVSANKRIDRVESWPIENKIVFSKVIALVLECATSPER